MVRCRGGVTDESDRCQWRTSRRFGAVDAPRFRHARWTRDEPGRGTGDPRSRGVAATPVTCTFAHAYGVELIGYLSNNVVANQIERLYERVTCGD